MFVAAAKGLLSLAPKIGKIAPQALTVLRAATARVGSVFSKAAPKAAGMADDVAAVTARAGVTPLRETAKGAGFLNQPVSRKAMLGFSAAGAIGPTVLAVTDNMTGNAISGTLLKTPVGKPLEYLLKFNTWSNNEQANVIGANLTQHMIKRGMINDGDPDFERSQRLISALSHAAIGDGLGAATIAADEDVRPEDLLAAMNKARDQHPDASMDEQMGFAFQTLQETLSERSPTATAKSTVGAVELASAQDNVSAQSSVLAVPAAGAAFGGAAMARSAAREKKPRLTEAFDTVPIENKGLFERIWDAITDWFKGLLSGFVDMFDGEEIGERAARLGESAQNGRVHSMGNLHTNGPSRDFIPQRPAMDLTPDMA